MEDIAVFELPLEGWIFIIFLLIGILFILWFSSLVRIGRLKKKLNIFIKGTGVKDLEAVFKELQAQNEQVAATAKQSGQRMDELENIVRNMKGNIGFLRYNAFGDLGSDLSFSLAIVNDKQDGVVISSLYGRDESRVYAKPLESGHSKYPLTPEEKEAIIQASRKA